MSKVLPTMELQEARLGFEALKTEFDLYFAGQRKLPPIKERDALAQKMRRLQYMQVRDNAVKFKISNLVARFHSYNEMWNRRLREIEEGPRRVQVAPGKVTTEKGANGGVVILSPQTEVGKLRSIYMDYVTRKEEVTGKPSRMGYEAFKLKFAQQLEEYKRKNNCQAVEVIVKEREGKVKFVLRPIKEEP